MQACERREWVVLIYEWIRWKVKCLGLHVNRARTNSAINNKQASSYIRAEREWRAGTTASSAKGGRPSTTAVIPRRHLLASQPWGPRSLAVRRLPRMHEVVGSNPTEGKICFSQFTLFYRVECEKLFCKTRAVATIGAWGAKAPHQSVWPPPPNIWEI